MQLGFMYLTAIINGYSRYIVGWGLSNTVAAEASQAVAEYKAPNILNADQGSQFTRGEYIDYLKDQGIAIRIHGKGRALDNICIEGF